MTRACWVTFAAATLTVWGCGEQGAPRPTAPALSPSAVEPVPAPSAADPAAPATRTAVAPTAVAPTAVAPTAVAPTAVASSAVRPTATAPGRRAAPAPGVGASTTPAHAGGRRVVALSGAVAAGEPLPAFVDTSALSPNRPLREGLARLARSRPTRGLMLTLERQPDRGCAAVVAALWHRAANVRAQAAQLVVRLRCEGPDLSAAQRRGLRKEPDQDVRAQVAKSLLTRPSPQLVPVLGEVVRGDRSVAVRAQCARALSGQDAALAAPHLLVALRDTAPKVRAHSASALGRLRVRAAKPALELALADVDRHVRRSAARALKLITGRSWRERPPRRP